MASVELDPPKTSSHLEYPPSQPFIHDNYRRDVTKPIIPYPESNRQGVMSALKNLQQRIKQIEHDKRQTEMNLQNLKYGSELTNEKSPAVNVSTGLLADTTLVSDMHGKLQVQEERVSTLQKQLEHARLVALNAERDRAETLRTLSRLRDEKRSLSSSERKDYEMKLSELEREHLKLMASQTLASSKLHDLESKLEQERVYRQHSGIHSPECEVDACDTYCAGDMIKTQRRRKKSSASAKIPARPATGAVGRKYPLSSKNSMSSKLPGSEPPEHYHLNLNEIPFLTGKSTGQSYSLSANFQQVLSLMKSHNTKLCAGALKHSHGSHVVRQSSLTALSRAVLPDNEDASKSATSRSADELTDLLHQLQDEFRGMSCEHEELVNQIKETKDSHLQDDLERELDGLVERMQIKGEQITKLRRLYDTLTSQGNGRKKSRSRVRTATSSHSYPSASVSRLPSSQATAGDVVTYSANGRGALVQAPSSQSKAQGSLNLLKDLKKIQTTLRQDDIVWVN